MLFSNWQKHKEGELSKTESLCNTALDLLGLALTMGAAIWLGRLAGGYAGQTWGILAGIIAGMAVGFGVALVVGKLWGKVSDPMKATAA